MRLSHLLELLESNRGEGLERYYRNEHLSVELESHLAREPGHNLSRLERCLYAASSYFAA